MPIVDYREAPQNEHQLASAGTLLKLDTDTGDVFDEKGNTVAKWEPRGDNEEQAQALSDYAYDVVARAGSLAMSTVDPEYGKSLYRSYHQNVHRMTGRTDMSGGGADVQLLDLGTSDVHLPAALGNYAAGYRNAPPMADMVAPPIPVDKLVNNYFTFAKEDAFQRAYPNTGAPGAAVYEIPPRLANAQYACIERALGGRVSPQVEANADAPLRILQATVKRVMNAMILEREFRVQSLSRTTANWNAAQVATLLAAFKWNGGASSDPIFDIHSRIEASFGPGLTGMLMSEKAHNAFVRNPAVRAYYAYKDGTPNIPTPEQSGPLLRLPPVFVSKMKYINSSGNLDYVWGGDVVLFRQPDEMPPTSQDDVATATTFRWNAAGFTGALKDVSAVTGGFVVRQFYEQYSGSMGFNRVVILHHDAEVMTSKFVGGLIVGAYQ